MRARQTENETRLAQEPEATGRISAWTGEFVDPAEEKNFRLDFYESQRRQTRNLTILLMCLFAPVGLIEYFNAGHLDGFVYFLCGHIFSGLMMIVMMYAVIRRWSYRALELLTVGFFLYVVAESALLLNIYKNDIIAIAVRLPLYAIIGNVMILLSARSRLALNCAAIPVFLGALWFLDTVSEDTSINVGIVVAMGFLFGITAGSWLGRTRRQEYQRRLQLQASNDALLESRRRAEIAVSAKSIFLANVSHELRTPLNAIIGFSQVLQHEIYGRIDNAKYSEYIDDIHNSGVHLLDLINDLLDLTKIEAGKAAMKQEWLPLHTACVETQKLVAAAQPGQKGMLRLGSFPDVEICFDGRALRQVLSNLLTNALKYAGPEATVMITAEQTPDHGLCIHVVDDGAGMSAEVLARVLQPFEQQEAGISRQTNGWGLGLPLANALVEANEARLEITSNIGQGTTATIHIASQRVRHDLSRTEPLNDEQIELMVPATGTAKVA